MDSGSAAADLPTEDSAGAGGACVRPKGSLDVESAAGAGHGRGGHAGRNDQDVQTSFSNFLSQVRPPSAFGVSASLISGSSGQVAAPRLHHLDWLRSMMIALALYLHCWQILSKDGDSDAFKVDYAMLAADSPDAKRIRYLAGLRQSDLQFRWISLGRQFTIPLLFFITGASLALSQCRIAMACRKIAVITVVGMCCNAIIYVIGPMDGDCSLTKYRTIPDAETRCRGWAIDFAVVSGAGCMFSVMYQFWFTVFLLGFLLEDAVLYRSLYDMFHKLDPPGCTWMVDRRVLVRNVVRSVGLTLFLLAFTLWGDGEGIWMCALWVAGFEVLFDLCLVACVVTPSTSPQQVRLWQYAAAAIVLCQFCLPDFDIAAMDGAVTIYFHIFKQFTALGFTMTLTREKSGPVLSRCWPLSILLIIVCAPSTNWFSAGMPTYPWMPKVRDRVLYTLGSLVCVFILDRVGRTFSAAGLLAPLPRPVQMGALLGFMFHPACIVLIVSFVPYGRAAHPLLIASAIIACLAGVGSLLPARRQGSDIDELRASINTPGDCAVRVPSSV